MHVFFNINMCQDCITPQWWTDIYNVFDVELWRDGEFLRTIYQEHAASKCDLLMSQLKNGVITPEEFMTDVDVNGNYEIKLNHLGVRVSTVFESRRG